VEGADMTTGYGTLGAAAVAAVEAAARDWHGKVGRDLGFPR
jgi:hypothetical protein